MYGWVSATQVEQKAAAVAVSADGYGGSGAECAATLRFFERLLQAAVDLLDEVVLMDETETARPDVLVGFVHCYHAWFADRIRALCDRRATADEGKDSPEHSQSSSVPFTEEMRTTIAYANRSHLLYTPFVVALDWLMRVGVAFSTNPQVAQLGEPV